ncbi:HlyD family secretion protein [Flavobacterium columnare]|uniref:HlyD family secretion protein n=1 Tax=Flavobacterium columnare TaxID=996 RepID=A0AAI8CFY1_9FLAO|nr:HlyD family secretion protein [Flavobacterium columnare]AMO19373.1 HlyD family secretion protein [Flavobacterium columnare]AUX17308.1 secretion protein HlyD [Flavobacterium columnare]QOG56329.1 HlyD family secretion protein [Flavobacterium columnare]QOG59052.1 HlyD family secretion protein [Flavobacterium columnare]QOG61774.1 HlyD family secretion protein [Flavobacterium columnare]
METGKKSINKKFAIILGALVIGGGSYGISKYLHAQTHEETDDAQVEKKMTPIIPRVSGYVSKVYVKDNDFVKKGDTLFVIDNRDYLVKVEEAKAALVASESSFEVAKADVGSANASVAASDANVASALGTIETAKIRLERATSDYERYNNLYKNRSITKQQYEQALATKLEAENQVKILTNQQKASSHQKNVVASKAIVSNKQTQVASANISRAKASLNAAELNLEYTIIRATIDGQVSKINIQPGQLVNQGQSLFYIVDTAETWVVANFKETQLGKMKIGQEVVIKIDAFDDFKLKGKITSFSPATGSQFSILPPDNATGNFVKTVQRVPVKIEFTNDNEKNKIELLRSGMNAHVDVHLK